MSGSHVKRVLLLLVFTAGALLVLAQMAAAADVKTTFADAEESFLVKINEERRSQGLGPLALDVQLTRVARGWSDVMLARDEMKHNPDYSTQIQGPWTRLGENVGFTVKTGASREELVQRLHTAFMNSPGHRANVLGDFNSVGVGVRIADSGKLWVTVNFMKAPPDVASAGQIAEAVHMSRRLFSNGRAAQYVVIGRADVFADALGGAGLAADQAPMLFTPGPRSFDTDPALHPAVRAEVDRLLGRSGTVYVLGGPNAVSSRAEAELRHDGYQVRRLAGTSRVETSVAVAREMVRRFGAPSQVLLSRADQWADAVTGGAYAASTRSPILLTDRTRLHPSVAAFLDEFKPRQRWVLGGSAALSDVVVSAARATRVSGPDRSATAVAIAEQLWGKTVAAAGDGYVSAPGDGSGWAYALAYAPWSAVHGSPQLLVGGDVPVSVEQYLQRMGYGGAVKGAVEAPSVVPGSVVQHLRTLVAG